MSRTNLNDDEFDIEILAQKTYSVFRKIAHKILFPVRLLFMKPLRLFSFVVAGIIVAVIFRYTLKPVYQSDFIVRPANKSDLYFMNLLLDLGNLINDKDYVSVSQQLKLDENTCSNISKIGLQLIRKSKSTDSADAVIIYILTKDNTLFDTIQSTLLNYLETSVYYNKVRELRKRDIEEMRIKLAKDMTEIDSLKKSLVQNMQPRNAGGFVYGEPINPVSVYEEDLNLFKQQMSLKWQTSFVSNFELIKKCVPSEKPYSPRLSFLLPLCIAIALLLCLIYNYRKS